MRSPSWTQLESDGHRPLGLGGQGQQIVRQLGAGAAAGVGESFEDDGLAGPGGEGPVGDFRDLSLDDLPVLWRYSSA